MKPSLSSGGFVLFGFWEALSAIDCGRVIVQRAVNAEILSGHASSVPRRNTDELASEEATLTATAFH